MPPGGLFMEVRGASCLNLIMTNYSGDNPGYGRQMRPVIRQPFKAHSTEELMALLSGGDCNPGCHNHRDALFWS
jgi:hypothetical protein